MVSLGVAILCSEEQWEVAALLTDLVHVSTLFQQHFDNATLF